MNFLNRYHYCFSCDKETENPVIKDGQLFCQDCNPSATCSYCCAFVEIYLSCSNCNYPYCLEHITTYKYRNYHECIDCYKKSTDEK